MSKQKQKKLKFLKKSGE